MANQPSGSATARLKKTRRELYQILQRDKISLTTPSECIGHLLNYIGDTFGLVEQFSLSPLFEKSVKKAIEVFIRNLKSRWLSCRRIKTKFNEKNVLWLQNEFKVPTLPSNQKSGMRGRPRKLFTESSNKTKNRDTSITNLITSTKKSLHSLGKRKAAEVMQLANVATPKSLKRMKDAFSPPIQKFRPYSPEESLALMIDLNLSKEQYITMQKGAQDRGVDFYAAYSTISQIKKQCFPENDSITVTELGAKVRLQSLPDHTTIRLTTLQQPVLQHIPQDNDSINFYHKWGLDGSGGHSIYKQNFTDPNIFHADANIIFTNLVLLELSGPSSNADAKQIYWKNTTPSATRYCRPIKFELEKETKANTSRHYAEIKEQIDHLEPTEIVVNDRTVFVKHIVLGTMFDGKVVNVLTNNAATQRCYICKAMQKDMNKLEMFLEMECNEIYYEFGPSVLHAYIRTFELPLHVSYKSELKEWQARGPEAKTTVQTKKVSITKKFYEEMGLVVDLPKQGGGNTNDGNTARKFFSNPEKSGEITGLNPDLIGRFSTILTTLSSGHNIDTAKFKKYCIDTAKLYVDMYKWFPMTPTVHKLLIHSAAISEKMILPIGQLSEDAQESRQKDWKTTRLQHTRKTSRVNTNTDIIPFTQEVLQLLKSPSVTSMAVEDVTDSELSE